MLVLVGKCTVNIIRVVRISCRIIKIRLIIDESIETIICASGVSNEQKDCFYDALWWSTSIINDSDIVFLVGNFNRYAGQNHDGKTRVYGNYIYGSQNEVRSWILEFCDRNKQDTWPLSNHMNKKTKQISSAVRI